MFTITDLVGSLKETGGNLETVEKQGFKMKGSDASSGPLAGQRQRISLIPLGFLHDLMYDIQFCRAPAFPEVEGGPSVVHFPQQKCPNSANPVTTFPL